MPSQLRWPFRIDHTGTVGVVDRDRLEGTAQAVRLTITTQPGERVVAATFGVPDPTFTGLSDTDILEAVARWVPRAVVQVAADPADGDGVQRGRIDVVGVR